MLPRLPLPPLPLPPGVDWFGRAVASPELRRAKRSDTESLSCGATSPGENDSS